MCASLNYRKKMKAERNQLIPPKPIEYLLEQGFPTWGTCTLGVHLPIRRGTFKVRNRR